MGSKWQKPLTDFQSVSPVGICCAICGKGDRVTAAFNQFVTFSGLRSIHKQTDK
jgi:hypothetical protein